MSSFFIIKQTSCYKENAYKMNFIFCVLFVYDDNGSVQTHNAQTRVMYKGWKGEIHFIYLHCFYVFGLCFINRSLWNSCVYGEKSNGIQLMEDPRKNNSVRQQPCHHEYKENFDISQSEMFFNNDSCFQTNLIKRNYSEKNYERH